MIMNHGLGEGLQGVISTDDWDLERCDWQLRSLLRESPGVWDVP